MTILKNYLFNIPLALLIFSGCQNNDTYKASSSTDEKTPTVLVTHPQHRQFNTLLNISGMAKPNRQVKIFAMSNGYLKESRVDIGDIVHQGQIIAVLENPELFSQKMKLQAEIRGKQALYERLKGIYAKTPELTTVIDVENAQAEYESLKAQLENVETQITYLSVRAPFSGVITSRFVDKGMIIQSSLNNVNSTPLYELQDIHTIRISVEVPESDSAIITKGVKATIIFPELPQNSIQATVSRTTFGLNPATRTMEAQLDIPNPDRKISSGMYANVKFERSGFKETLALPNEAIANLKGESYVYTVHEGFAHKVAVKTGVRDEKYTEIIDGNITHNDVVVMQGKELCAQGSSVKIKTASNQ